MSYAIVFRAYPDVDHMAPLAWKLLEEGEEVHAVISPGYEPERDYRLSFLKRYPGFHLHEVDPPVSREGWRGRLARARSLWRRSLPWALIFVARHRVALVAVEWGYGLRPGYERLHSPAGIADVARSFAGSWRHRDRPRQLRSNFMVAARLLSRPIICLPHGLSVKLGRGANNGELLPGPLDWRDRNRFDVYVLNTDHHRTWFLAHAAADPAVMQTWGSLRWAPEWFELNRRLAPPFAWPAQDDAAARVKVVYMVPKWNNHVDREAALELVKTLQNVKQISLAIKAHPRPEGNADPLRDDPEIDWTRLIDAGGVDSVSLIGAADVVIDVGSSIGIEVLMQGKVLVNPTYIHDFFTLFDEIPGSCVLASDAEAVARYLRGHAKGKARPAEAAALREVLRRGVYGSRPEPYDVIGTYVTRVRALADTPSPT